MKNNKQAGFGVVEAIIIVIVVGVIGAVGYIAWQKMYPAQSSTSSTKTTTPNTSTSSTTVTGADAKTLVGTFYSKYYAAVVNGYTPNSNVTPNTSLMKELVNEYGTSNLVTSYADAKASDPILCAQAYPQAVPTVTDVVASGNNATVTIQDIYSSEPAPHTYKATVVNQGGLKIDAVTCPAP